MKYPLMKKSVSTDDYAKQQPQYCPAIQEDDLRLFQIILAQNFAPSPVSNTIMFLIIQFYITINPGYVPYCFNFFRKNSPYRNIEHFYTDCLIHTTIVYQYKPLITVVGSILVPFLRSSK